MPPARPRKSRAREPLYPGWHTCKAGHVQGYYHWSCLKRTGDPYVIEVDTDYAKRDAAPCPLCVAPPQSAGTNGARPAAPRAQSASNPDQGLKYAGWCAIGAGVVWATFHEACVSRAAERAALAEGTSAMHQDGRPCPLCE